MYYDSETSRFQKKEQLDKINNPEWLCNLLNVVLEKCYLLCRSSTAQDGWHPAHNGTIAEMQLLALWKRKEAGCHKPQSQNTLLF